jgi:acetamidase/formamidase
MRRTIFSTLFVLSILCPCLPAQSAVASQRPDLSGEWVLYLLQFGERTDSARVELREAGDNITGALNNNELKLAGTIKGDVVQLTLLRQNGDIFAKMQIAIGAQSKSAELKGTYTRGSVQTDLVMHRLGGQGTTPQTHDFVPTTYSRVFSSSLTPVLSINPGDTVRTTTIDAGGYDGKGVPRAPGGNPQTGPFYVEGALPGDTLAIKIDRLHLNRDSASSTSIIIPVALTADYYRDAKLDGSVSGEWKLDREHGTASPAQPTEHLKNFKIEMKPMIGCISVAPGNNASFRTAWLGPWGGNMDYDGIGEGTTLYLPVAQEGALLYLGDVHAKEGDGELNGNALETSADVEFTVNVIHGVSTLGPRAEDGEYLMSMGIAGSLDAALKLATTQLAEWLERDYKLSPNEAAIVIGSSVHYQIAEVADPQVNVVAKLSKVTLAQISK